MSALQIETFSLARGSTVESFLALNEAFQVWCYQNRPGLARRTVARRGERWLVDTVWARAADAEAEFARTAPVVTAWFAALEAHSYESAVYENLG